MQKRTKAVRKTRFGTDFFLVGCFWSDFCCLISKDGKTKLGTASWQYPEYPVHFSY
jgi:hypothetical protein